MIEEFVAVVSGFILNIIELWGYFGIFVLMTLESANIPIPSEIIMAFSGFLVSTGKLNFWFVVLAGALGNLLGSLLNYFLAYRYGKKAINFLRRFAFMERQDFDIAESWFKKFGLFSSFFMRLMPVLRTFISFPAGMFRVNIIEFSLLTFIGSFFWSLILTYIGYVAGANWNFLEPYFRRLDVLIMIVVLGLLGWFAYRRLMKRMLK
ncbi:MAG: DedA family protein [Candidatus Colwellbacteria bacterium]|nr:DedA family protein [Candidatus Colwellbacteria bacterium]MBI3274185.1 DedA family protein [Candidatus Colwellbacteria bacterium]